MDAPHYPLEPWMHHLLATKLRARGEFYVARDVAKWNQRTTMQALLWLLPRYRRRTWSQHMGRLLPRPSPHSWPQLYAQNYEQERDRKSRQTR